MLTLGQELVLYDGVGATLAVVGVRSVWRCVLAQLGARVCSCWFPGLGMALMPGRACPYCGPDEAFVPCAAGKARQSAGRQPIGRSQRLAAARGLVRLLAVAMWSMRAGALYDADGVRRRPG